MGCDTYECEGTLIRFSEMDDGGCLCTFPHNDQGKLTQRRVRSLAMLGAAVVLLHHGELEGPVFLPYSLPQWLVGEIKRLLLDQNYQLEESGILCGLQINDC